MYNYYALISHDAVTKREAIKTAKQLVEKAVKKRMCHVCKRDIHQKEKHFTISKGGYGNWNICKECFTTIYNELIK